MFFLENTLGGNLHSHTSSLFPQEKSILPGVAVVTSTKHGNSIELQGIKPINLMAAHRPTEAMYDNFLFFRHPFTRTTGDFSSVLLILTTQQLNHPREASSMLRLQSQHHCPSTKLQDT